MPTLGSPAAGFRKGVTIPTGSLDLWRAARAAHATDRPEVVFFGDSTWWGQSADGGVTDAYQATAGNRSPLNAIRAAMVAAGYTDGGPGIIGYSDRKEIHGITVDPIAAGRTAQVGSSMSPTGGNLISQQGFGLSSTQAVTFQGPYTCARIYCSAVGDSGTFTYSINGGTPVSITPGTAGGWTINYVSGMPGGQTNTLAIQNVSGNNRIDVELMNATGIVLHKHACPGAQVGSFVSFPQDDGNNSGLRIALGAVNTSAAALQATEGTHPTARKVRLAVWTLGVNDLTQVGAQNVITVADKDTPANTRTIAREASTFARSTELFASIARAVGADPVIVIPHWNVSASVNQSRYLLVEALTSIAMAHSCALWDANEALGGPLGNWSTSYYQVGNVHLNAAGYDRLGAQFAQDILLA